MTDIPYRFERADHAVVVTENFENLEPGEETDYLATVAGRLMLRRVQGKVAFGTLQDESGRMQLFLSASWTERFDAFCDLSLGDWIGATGPVVKTKRGEVSVKVTSWVLLAETRRPFPDKWHGLSDPDVRYRQRYVDLWVTEEVRPVFVLRSELLGFMRSWLERREFVEVETPVFHPVPGGASAKPFVTHHNALGMELCLRIATELYLKRLIVGGFEKVYEIGRTFRNEGMSSRHNPEFTMIELYQAYADYTDMMELTEQLVAHLAEESFLTTSITYDGRTLELAPPWPRRPMTELVEEHAGVAVDVAMPTGELRRIAKGFDIPVEDAWGPGKLVLEIYEKTTEHALWGPVFVLDYPQEVSPLARPHRSKPGYVERFEAVVAGRELANAFSELVDPDLQRAAFEAQARAKVVGDEEAMPVDEDFLRALEYGMPPTGGLGIGIDRLVMLFADVHHIRDVLLFPALRPEQDRG